MLNQKGRLLCLTWKVFAPGRSWDVSRGKAGGCPLTPAATGLTQTAFWHKPRCAKPKWYAIGLAMRWLCRGSGYNFVNRQSLSVKAELVSPVQKKQMETCRSHDALFLRSLSWSKTITAIPGCTAALPATAPKSAPYPKLPHTRPADGVVGVVAVCGPAVPGHASSGVCLEGLDAPVALQGWKGALCFVAPPPAVLIESPGAVKEAAVGRVFLTGICTPSARSRTKGLNSQGFV